MERIGGFLAVRHACSQPEGLRSERPFLSPAAGVTGE